MNRIDLGAVSAYALAKEKGYQGTGEEFATLMMQSGDNALRAEAAANRAEEILGSIPPEYTDLSNQVGENTGNVAALTEEMSWMTRSEYNANFPMDCVEITNRIHLKEPTGRPNHTNILWMKAFEDKDMEYFHFNASIPSDLNNTYIRFFVSGNSKDVFYFFPVTFTDTRIAIDYYLWNNELIKIGGIGKDGTISDFDNIDVKMRYANGILVVYINNMLIGRVTLNISQNIQMGVGWRDNSQRVYYSNLTGKERKPPFVHVSVDDVRHCLYDITNNQATYTSLFRNSFFAKLREWHLAYGAVFSLYVFNYYDDAGTVELLKNVPAQYINEFKDCSAWLKFGVHSPRATDYYANFSDEDVVSTYTEMVNEIIRFAGVGAVDGMPRFGYYSVNKSALVALKDAHVGFCGCLTSDDNRANDSGLTAAEKDIIHNFDSYYDFENGIAYMRSSKRFDDYDQSQNIENFKSEYLHQATNHEFILFLHEDNASKSYSSVEDVLTMVRNLGLRYDYPINNLIF